MKNTFGSDLSLTIFGESHGRAVGAVLDGMAAGVPVDESFLAACMDKRRARGNGLSTPRVEADAVQLLSGVVNGHTTGTAIALMIENQNTRSADYAKTADLLRPGHADFTAYAKYHGFQDARGGGHFSGRVTAALVAGGSIVLAALQRAGIDITTHIARCAGLADTPFALDDPAALAAQVETLASKTEGFAVLDAAVEEPMKAAIRAAARQLKQQGADYALVTLKDAAGTVYYASGVAAAAQSITENPVDAANIAAILREEGIIPAAQLAAFTDPVSVYTDRSMGVHYDGNSLWLDNVSAAKGGKAWMNPFAASAVQYVGDLIEEVQGMGYEQVVLTGVQFPNIITRKQDFGASGGKSREGRAAQLTADIAAWQTRFAGSVTLWVSYPDALCTAATDALGTTGTSLGMENLLVTSSTALDADSRAALEQAAADAGVQHVVVHDTAAFR